MTEQLYHTEIKYKKVGPAWVAQFYVTDGKHMFENMVSNIKSLDALKERVKEFLGDIQPLDETTGSNSGKANKD